MADAREGQDLELSVGGVPINESGNLHGNGYADTHFIIPELAASLRVIEGPFDPRQGNFAVAGSADYALGLQQRGVTSRFIFMSGYAEDAFERNLENPDDFAFIQKPFTPLGLARKVRQVIDGTGA